MSYIVCILFILKHILYRALVNLASKAYFDMWKGRVIEID